MLDIPEYTNYTIPYYTVLEYERSKVGWFIWSCSTQVMLGDWPSESEVEHTRGFQDKPDVCLKTLARRCLRCHDVGVKAARLTEQNRVRVLA